MSNEVGMRETLRLSPEALPRCSLTQENKPKVQLPYIITDDDHPEI